MPESFPEPTMAPEAKKPLEIRPAERKGADFMTGRPMGNEPYVLESGTEARENDSADKFSDMRRKDRERIMNENKPEDQSSDEFRDMRKKDRERIMNENKPEGDQEDTGKGPNYKMPEGLEDGFKKIGEAVSKRIDELKAEGMSDADAHAKAHDEFWGNIDPSGPKQKDPFPPEDQIEGTPFYVRDGNERNKPESTPEGPNPEQKEALAVADLELAIADFANARISLEKILGGGPEEQYKFDKAEAALHEKFNEWKMALAEKIAARNEEINQDIALANGQRSNIGNQIKTLQSELNSPDVTPERSAQIKDEMNKLAAQYQLLSEQINALQMEMLDAQQEAQELAVQKVAEVRKRVDAEMIAQREKAHPRLTKIANWLKAHPKTRLITGLAFSAMAVTGFATGIVPLGVIGTLGRSALGGFGAYNAVRTGGDWLGNRQMNNADLSTIEGYTEAAEKQSDTIRKSKKVGAGAAAVVAAIPIVRGLQHLNLRGPAGPQGPQGPAGPQGPEGAPGQNGITVIDRPPTIDTPNFPADDNYPWTHFKNLLGSNEAATNKIYELVNKAPKLGWNIEHVNSGQSYAIPRIIAPDGRVITGHANINRALDLINAAVNQQGI